MKIFNFPNKNHRTRQAVFDMAQSSVNTDAPNPGLEVLRAIDLQLETYNLEIVVFDNGDDAIIWKIQTFDSTKPVKIPIPASTRTTSDRVSTLAASFLRLSDDRIRQAVIDSPDFINSLRSIAASALAQDEEPRRK